MGGSRGIGLAIGKILEAEAELMIVSRGLCSDKFPKATCIQLDMTDEKSIHELFVRLRDFNPKRIFYVAGGGPYGEFSKKDFKDHLWAYQLNLLTPAKLLQWGLKVEIGQMIFFGSAIAESSPDPMSSSYSSSKHGLLGLVTSVRAEKPKTDLRVYSPGYTATSLLPKKAQEKHKEVLLDPALVARDFIQWAYSDNGEFHRIFTSEEQKK